MRFDSSHFQPSSDETCITITAFVYYKQKYHDLHVFIYFEKKYSSTVVKIQNEIFVSYLPLTLWKIYLSSVKNALLLFLKKIIVLK